MATVFAKVNDAAGGVTQDTTEVAADIGTQLGVVGDELGASPTTGSVVTHPQMGYAGALATIDDLAYVDTADGLIGAASRFFPGSGQAVGYENEAKVLKSQGGVTTFNYRAALGPVGTTPDIDTVMGL